MKMGPAGRVVEDLEDELSGKGGAGRCCDGETFEESEVGVVSRP